MFRKLALAALVAVLASAGSVASASPDHTSLARVFLATARYRSLSTAQAADYHQLVDVNGVACIDMPGSGAMGVHYVKDALVGDGKVDPLKPEALVYEPDQQGHSRLVAVEYVVFKDAWDAKHPQPPSLFGHEFDFTSSPNRYGLAPFYSLHAWIWKFNPAGTFAMWNPRVTCAPGAAGHEHDTMTMDDMPSRHVTHRVTVV